MCDSVHQYSASSGQIPVKWPFSSNSVLLTWLVSVSSWWTNLKWIPLDPLMPLANLHTAETQSRKILGPGINFKGHILLCNKPVSEAYFTLKKDFVRTGQQQTAAEDVLPSCRLWWAVTAAGLTGTPVSLLIRSSNLNSSLRRPVRHPTTCLLLFKQTVNQSLSVLNCSFYCKLSFHWMKLPKWRLKTGQAMLKEAENIHVNTVSWKYAIICFIPYL